MAQPGDSVVHAHSVKHFEGSHRMLHALAVPNQGAVSLFQLYTLALQVKEDFVMIPASELSK
jgi:hypothetical protein